MWMQAVMDPDAGDQGKSEAAHHTAAGMPNATAEVRDISNKSTIALAPAAAQAGNSCVPKGHRQHPSPLKALHGG